MRVGVGVGVGAGVGASAGAGRTMSDVEFVTRRLTAELGDAAIAHELAAIIETDALSWRAPTIESARIRTIVGFTFGNRMAPNGNREPGPVNEALAAIAVRLSRETGAPVIAQWEVAEPAAAELAAGVVTPIHPARDARGEPLYLGTLGVLEEIARRNVPSALGTVGIVAFSDHIARSVETARRLGYLLHDVMLRLTERRAAMLTS